MIVDFKIKNYKSYKNSTSFTYEALDDTFKSDNYTSMKLDDGNTVNVLKSAVIFGANASGKSNIIWAMKALSSLVAYSRSFDTRTPIPVYLPFLLDKESSKSPTELSISFIINKKLYQYEIHFNQIFTYECLSEIRDKKELVIFKLDGEKNPEGRGLVIGEGWPSSKFELGEALANHLMLSEIGIKPANELLDVYSYLASLEVEPVGDAINLKLNNENAAGNILKNSNSRLFNRLKKLIHIADMGINDVKMVEHGASEFKFPESVPEELKKNIIDNNKWEFGLVHQTSSDSEMAENVTLNMNIESTGTKNLFGLGARILDVLDKGGFLAYDEMNIAIHPALFKLLVSLFHHEKSNPHHAQLLFTTHDASIADESLLRSDQIWFAEKDDTGASQLYSAQDFEDGSINMPVERWYRSGRFGALPKFGNIDYIFDDEDKE